MKKKSLTILFFFLFFYILASSGHFYSADEVISYRVTMSILENAKIDVKPDGDWSYGVGKLGNDNKFYSKYGIGYSLAAIPFCLIGKAVSNLYPQEKKEPISQFFFAMLSPFVTALICFVIFLFAVNLGYSHEVSLSASLMYGFCTIAFPYAKFSNNVQLASFLLLLSVYFVNYCKAFPSRAFLGIFLSGLFFSFGMITRPEIIILFPFLAFYAVLLLRRPVFNIKRAALFFLPIVLSIVFLGLYNYVRFGSFFSTGYADDERFFLPSVKNICGLLFSSGKSMFLYSPPFVLLFAAYFSFYKKHKSEAIVFSLMFLVLLFFVSGWHQWQGGYAWGPRLLIPIFPLLSIIICEFLDKAFVSSGQYKWYKASILFFFVTGFFVQIVAIITNSTFFMLAVKNFNVPIDEVSFDPFFSPVLAQIKQFFLLFSSPARITTDFWLANSNFFPANIRIIFFFLCAIVVIILGFKILKSISQEKN